MSTALTILCQLADQSKRQKHPNVPYLVRAKYTDRTANDLTRCVVDWFNLCGHFATRLQSIGTYRDDLKKWVPSQQRAGLPDVFAVIEGHAVFCEIKVGKDSLSQVQRETVKQLLLSGAYVFIARDFQSFYDWFLTVQPQLKRAERLPFQP